MHPKNCGYEFAASSIPCHSKWLLSIWSYPQQCISKRLLPTTVCGYFVIANGRYQLAVIRSNLFENIAMNLKLTRCFVLANGCYQWAVIRSNVLANGCYQFAVNCQQCISEWLLWISDCLPPCILANGDHQLTVTSSNALTMTAVNLRSTCSCAIANDCGQFALICINVLKLLLSTCIEPLPGIRKRCYEFAVLTTPRYWQMVTTNLQRALANSCYKSVVCSILYHGKWMPFNLQSPAAMS